MILRMVTKGSRSQNMFNIVFVMKCLVRGHPKRVCTATRGTTFLKQISEDVGYEVWLLVESMALSSFAYLTLKREN